MTEEQAAKLLWAEFAAYYGTSIDAIYHDMYDTAIDGLSKGETDCIIRAINNAREAALEEAAAAAVRIMQRGGYPPEASEVSAAIRSLKSRPQPSEREAIVKWLRTEGGDDYGFDCADAIARGDHLPKPTAEGEQAP